jgi:protoheme IX farnesyltransferase
MTAENVAAESAEPAKFRDYLELTKPRLSLLSVLTALVGYFAARPAVDGVKIFCVVVGTSLAAGGVAALNQWMESDTDARMKRTADRPIPTGKVATGSAFVLGTIMCIASLFLLFAKVHPLAALFTLLTIVSYLGWYTPAKRWSRWSTEIGAIAGAFPPLIGWAAGEGKVTTLGWILFGVLFFWQIPHFMAIAWTYRRDYSTVHFPMLPVRDETGAWVACYFGLATRWYGLPAALCGAWMLWRAALFLRARGRDLSARKLFLTTLAYLPIALGALVADRVAHF